jgi:FkbM family methyltransferase
MKFPSFLHWGKWRQLHRDFGEIRAHFWQPLTIFDVGANNGASFFGVAHLPWVKVYAFEPTPEMLPNLRSIASRLPNYQVIPKAVGELPGLTSFNVAGAGDWGCSSLLEFSAGLEHTWPGRDDLRVTQQIQVEVIRLDDFITANRIKRIDFLHVDTQGTDLGVLRSLGKEMHRVKAGCIEAPQSAAVKLYQQQHTLEEALEFLTQNGFRVYRKQFQQNEVNLFFERAAGNSRA